MRNPRRPQISTFSPHKHLSHNFMLRLDKDRMIGTVTMVQLNVSPFMSLLSPIRPASLKGSWFLSRDFDSKNLNLTWKSYLQRSIRISNLNFSDILLFGSIAQIAKKTSRRNPRLGNLQIPDDWLTTRKFQKICIILFFCKYIFTFSCKKPYVVYE